MKSQIILVDNTPPQFGVQKKNIGQRLTLGEFIL